MPRQRASCGRATIGSSSIGRSAGRLDVPCGPATRISETRGGRGAFREGSAADLQRNSPLDSGIRPRVESEDFAVQRAAGPSARTRSRRIGMASSPAKCRTSLGTRTAGSSARTSVRFRKSRAETRTRDRRRPSQPRCRGFAGRGRGRGAPGQIGTRTTLASLRARISAATSLRAGRRSLPGGRSSRQTALERVVLRDPDSDLRDIRPGVGA